MKKLWLAIKEAYYNKMSNKHYLKYISYRDKLLATRLQSESEADPITPERREAIHRELMQMAKDLDRRERAAEVVVVEQRYWN